jgi:hypothetical protein
MAKSVTFTQNPNYYKDLNVPYFNYKHNWIDKFYKFPFGLKFNRTYYKHDGEKLVAFRILAYTFCDDRGKRKNDHHYPMYYLVQLPNKPLQWIVDFITQDTNVYLSVEDYVLSGGSCFVNLQWEFWITQFNVWSVHSDTFFFESDYWTIKKGAVVKSKGAWMDSFVATEDGFFVDIAKTSYHSHYNENGIYLDKMSATRELLQDMDVVDFENEPTSIKISINVLDNTPKYTKLQFVE